VTINCVISLFFLFYFIYSILFIDCTLIILTIYSHLLFESLTTIFILYLLFLTFHILILYNIEFNLAVHLLLSLVS